MELPPPHVLAQLDAIIVGQARESDGNYQNVLLGDEDDGDTTVAYDSGDETAPYLGEGGARTTSSRFWGVSWDRNKKKWHAYYTDVDGKMRSLGFYPSQREIDEITHAFRTQQGNKTTAAVEHNAKMRELSSRKRKGRVR